MTEMVYGAVPQPGKDPILPRWWRTIDKWSVSSIMLLFAVGILLGLAASPPLAERNGLHPFYYVERQVVFGLMAFGVMFVMTMMSPKLVRRLSVLGFLAAFAAIALLPWFGTDFGKGAVRWYSFGFASFQPSEFLKPFYVVVAAWLMAASYDIQGPPGKTMSLGLTLVIVGYLAMQPDFGQAVLVLFGWGVMFFLAGAHYVFIVGVAALVVGAGFIAYNNSEHFARRIDGFLNPELDPTTQLGYATNAIREGGYFGVGVGEGQVKWSLPDAHTDFIIAVAAEEYGLVLVLLILALYATIVVRSFLRLVHERDTFIRLAGTGLAAMFGVQALINIGVAVRLLPAKGMTLPFVSYGGSSLIAMGLSLGMLIAFTRTRPQGKFADYLTQRGYR